MKKFVTIMDFYDSTDYRKQVMANSLRIVYLQLFFAELWAHDLIDTDHYMFYLGMIDSNGWFMCSQKNRDHLLTLEVRLKEIVTDKKVIKLLWGNK